MSAAPSAVTSYIRELRADAGTSPTVVVVPSVAPPATDVVARANTTGDAPEVREQPEPAAPLERDTLVSPPPAVVAAEAPPEVARAATAHDDALDAFERRLITGRRASAPAVSPRARKAALGLVAVGAAATLAWFALARAPRARVTTAPRAAVRASVQPASAPAAVPAPAVTPPAVVEAPAPAAVPAAEAQSAEAALESEAVLPQPTAQLTALLQSAVSARRRGERAALDALQAWLDAGGTDAQPVAQFAYWLGQRNRLQLAAQWAERATTMDAGSQMAWYVLGATRLEDPRSSRAAAFDALRRCAGMTGRFTAECAGPLAHAATARER